MCDKLRTPRRPPSIFDARRGEIQDDLDPVSISAPTLWCASVVPCSVTAAMLTSRFGPLCSIALGSSKEMDRRCQLPSRASDRLRHHHRRERARQERFWALDAPVRAGWDARPRLAINSNPNVLHDLVDQRTPRKLRGLCG
jgi:hypothetical protein